jgi:serine protease AprX
MNRSIMIFFAAAVIILAVSAAEQQDAALGAWEKIDEQLSRVIAQGLDDEIPVIVMLKESCSDPIPGLDIRYSFRLIPAVAGQAQKSSIEQIAEDDRVSAIYYDRDAQVYAPSQSDNSSQLPPTESYISPAQIIKADRLQEMGIDGSGTVVAVIDSGIDKNHPDLVGRVVAEKNFLADEITADDLLGHGTMVAGIIAGSGAASGGKYAGIAPNATLLSAKVIDSKGDGRVSDIIAGIEWAVYSGADVLSLSLGGINLGESNPPITMAADNAAKAGVVVCVAAGNRNSSETAELAGSSAGRSSASQLGARPSQDTDSKDFYLLLVPIVVALPPGLIDSPGDGVNVITVGAADAIGRIAGFSGSGPTRDDRIKPDVVAPGVDIISTAPSGLSRPVYVEEYYAIESGTSLSTPVAAGLAALLLQARDTLSPAGVKAAMTGGAVKLNSSLGESYEEYYQGAGMLDALRSYDIAANSSDTICGVIPNRWNAGRWAYLPSGEGVYVGLYTGADRPQKKLYALAPGDDDWNLRLVFFSDSNITGLKASARGTAGDWMSLQPLPEGIEANDQKVFAASISVPDDALPGVYNGSIEISGEGKSLLEIPVSVRVAEPLNISGGVVEAAGRLQGNEWDYYYLDVNPGDRELYASLDWQGEAKLDLFLLSPTSEYYSGDGAEGLLPDRPREERLESPSSGRWIIAVHIENSTDAANYSLHVERSRIGVLPIRWNLDSAMPGSASSMEFSLKNYGPSLFNLSYGGVIENITSEQIEGTVLYKKVWEKAVNVTGSTRRLSARLLSEDKTNSSEMMLVFENPEGEPVDADLDAGDLGPLEISNPENGTWKIKVYGYDVPDAGQGFSVLYKEYSEDRWNWIQTSGPVDLESNEGGTLYANLTIPGETSLSRLDGYIKIASDGGSFEIPVGVTIAGSILEGPAGHEVYDTDGDGLFDVLSLGFALNITAGGEYRLKGELADCRGRSIDLIDRRERLPSSGIIAVNISGRDIWEHGSCGPLHIENLILYDGSGSFIDLFKGDIAIDLDPDQFQSPPALFTGEYVNLTDAGSIAIGVNVTVNRQGSYALQGIIVDDNGEEMGQAKAESYCSPGNSTIILQFDPVLFGMSEEPSAIRLVDLSLSREGEELERRDEAWRSEVMNPRAFGTASGLFDRGQSAGTKTRSNVRMDNGTAVIAAGPASRTDII